MNNWSDLSNWIPILSITFSLSNIIYGGVLKSNFQKQLNIKDEEQRELAQTLDANKEALTKATLKYTQLELERDFWKKRSEDSK